MAEGKDRQNWAYLSDLEALIANCHRDSKQHPAAFRAAQFDPYHTPRRPVRLPKAEQNDALQAAFL